MMTDYELGVEMASVVYKDIIREYSSKNTKLRELVEDLYFDLLGVTPESMCMLLEDRRSQMRKLGIEV